MVVQLQDVTPGPYRIAIHTTGNCSSPNGFSAGPPWAPPGGVPQVDAGAAGNTGWLTMTASLDRRRSRRPRWNLGKAVVVHRASAGSLDAQPGLPNNRIACGVIEISLPTNSDHRAGAAARAPPDASGVAMGFLADKKILITGLLSNRSIAYGVARACQREGATLAFTYVNDELKERVVEARRAISAPRRSCRCDVTQRRRHRRAVRDAASRVGRSRRPAALDRVRAARGARRRFPRRPDARGVRDRARHLELQLRGAGQGRAPADAGPRRRAAHAHLPRRRARDAELQRDGPRQGEPRGERALSRRLPRSRGHPRQRASRPDRSRRSPPRASAASRRS